MSLLNATYDPNLKFSDIVDIIAVDWDPVAFKLEELTPEQIESKLVNGSGFEEIIPLLYDSPHELIGQVMGKHINEYLVTPSEDRCHITIQQSSIVRNQFQFSLWSEPYGRFIYNIEIHIKNRRKNIDKF